MNLYIVHMEKRRLKNSRSKTIYEKSVILTTKIPKQKPHTTLTPNHWSIDRQICEYMYNEVYTFLDWNCTFCRFVDFTFFPLHSNMQNEKQFWSDIIFFLSLSPATAETQKLTPTNVSHFFRLIHNIEFETKKTWSNTVISVWYLYIEMYGPFHFNIMHELWQCFQLILTTPTTNQLILFICFLL